MKKYRLLLFMLCPISQLLHAQNIGIGTTNPLGALHIKRDGEALRLEGNVPYMTFYNNSGTLKGFMQNNGDHIYFGTAASNPNGLLQFYLNGVSRATMNAAGNMGIGTTNPLTALHIKRDGEALRLEGAVPYLTFYNNSGTLKGFLQNSGDDMILGTGAGNTNGRLQFYTNGVPKITLNSLGSLGIGYTTPVAGYSLSANGGAFINGLLLTAGDVEMQADARVSGTLFANGGIGIGGAPNCPLEVFSAVQYGTKGSWTRYDNGGFTTNDLCIRTHGSVLAEFYYAYSDERLKTIIGISNSASDLDIINSLRITNYNMKDKMKYGEKKFKKVIAQEVEKVFPQVVSREVGFIPNVYQLSSKIEKTGNGYKLSFANKHNISKTAKQLQVLLSDERSMKSFEIVALPSDYQVIIKASDIKTDKAFVYGEEVDDFRTVDYEGLTTLNISATQELSKLVKKQQEAIDVLTEEIKKMKAVGIVSIKQTDY